MNQDEIINYWIASARQDLDTANSLYETGHYHHCLFFWHLALEKILKSLIVKVGNQPPRTHDLGLLAKLANLTIDESMKTNFDEINAFNLEGRYDDYHFSFYKKATKQYADLWIPICQKYFENFNNDHE